jgi:NADH:ubiquinone oxidoreductase subunit C
MDKTQLADLLKSLDNEIIIADGKEFPEVTVDPSRLHSFAKVIKENEATCFDFLFCLTGVDYKDSLGVVYHLRSTIHGHTIVLKTRTNDRSNPIIDTVSDLWKTAEFHEREVYDLLGIKFNNHPDLRRFFLDKTFGYPLRKDFRDDVNVVTK